MLRQDYILDLIARAAALLARLLGRAAGEAPPDAGQLDAAAQAWTGLSLHLADLLDPDALLAALGTGPRADLHAAVLGMLLSARGHLYRQQGAEADGQADLARGLALMEGAAARLPVAAPELLEAIQAARAAR